MLQKEVGQAFVATKIRQRPHTSLVAAQYIYEFTSASETELEKEIRKISTTLSLSQKDEKQHLKYTKKRNSIL